jgi:hypothetical protein
MACARPRRVRGRGGRRCAGWPRQWSGTPGTPSCWARSWTATSGLLPPDAGGVAGRAGLLGEAEDRSPRGDRRVPAGFAGRTLGLRLPDKPRKEGAELRGRLERPGVFRASGHEHLAGSLVVPVFDEHGNVSEVYGRKVRDDLRAGTPRHLYPLGPHRGVWKLPAVAACDEVIIAESVIDALSFWCAGFRYVTAVTGRAG